MSAELTPQEIARFKKLFGAMPYSGMIPGGAYHIQTLDDVFAWLAQLSAALEGTAEAHSRVQRELYAIKYEIAGAGSLLRRLLGGVDPSAFLAGLVPAEQPAGRQGDLDRPARHGRHEGPGPPEGDPG